MQFGVSNFVRRCIKLAFEDGLLAKDWYEHKIKEPLDYDHYSFYQYNLMKGKIHHQPYKYEQLMTGATKLAEESNKLRKAFKKQYK